MAIRCTNGDSALWTLPLKEKSAAKAEDGTASEDSPERSAVLAKNVRRIATRFDADGTMILVVKEGNVVIAEQKIIGTGAGEKPQNQPLAQGKIDCFDAGNMPEQGSVVNRRG